MVISSFLLFRCSQTGLFYNLSAGEFCLLRIALDKPLGCELGAERLGAAVPPTDKS
jgi:hypothetical protein